MNRYTKKVEIAVAILGARMHYAVPEILFKHQILYKMYTDIYMGNKPIIAKLLKLFLGNRKFISPLFGRRSEFIPSDKIKSFDFLGIKYAIERKKAHSAVELSKVYSNTSIMFNDKIINEHIKCDAIYGFNTSSKEVFQYCKDNGILCILEQTIVPKIIENKILHNEVSQFGLIDHGLELDENNLMIEREQKEWELADLILAPSQFVYDGLIEAGVQKEKCRIVPYGVSKNAYTFLDKIRKESSKSFNILFAGHVGIRKGVHYLLQAIALLKSENIKVKIAGNITIDEKFLKSNGKNVEFLGRVPRQEMKKLYEWSDLFVFPSLCEGSATVIYESMMSGVPVLTTPNAGSIITHGVDGMIVKPQDVRSMAHIIDELANNNEQYNKLVEGVKINKEKASLKTYEKNLIDTINNFFKEIK